MSKSRKVLGVVLAVMLVLNVFAVSAFAAGATSYESDPAAYNQEWKVTKTSDTTATISLTTNYAVGPVQFKLNGTITGVTVGDGYYAGADIKLSGDNTLVLLVPDTEGTVPGKTMSGTVIANVTFSGATPTIVNAPKTAATPDGTLIASRLTEGTVNASNFVLGQSVSVLADGEASQAADLAVKAGAQEGILIDTHKTFGGAYAGVVYGFKQAANNTFKNSAYITAALEATNGGSLEVITSDGKTAATGNYGTGSTIVVKNANGSVAKTYVVCIFGDVDGNGLINTADANGVKASVNNTKIPNNSVQRLAANAQLVNNAVMMHNIVTGDASAVKGHVGGSAKLDMVALAAKHASFNNNYQ